jgi:hypothetical protein
MTIRIDEYAFGRITIDGVAYTDDVLILGGRVRSPWWRQAGGHVFAPVDLADVIESHPEIVLLGRGYFGLVTVTDEAVEALEAVGSQVVTGCTPNVVRDFNRLTSEGHDVAACLHLTC